MTSVANPIVIVGAPRSGTTWLAKIIDSHPDVLYRHEPDTDDPALDSLAIAEVPGFVARWAANRTPRSAAKGPFFRKSYRTGWKRAVRDLTIAGIRVLMRSPPWLRRGLSPSVPDLLSHQAGRIAIKSIRLADATAVFAAALPDSRVLFILRHPCGQVASVMRGNRQRRFDLKMAGTDMPFDEEATLRFAARLGVEQGAFQALPDAAKYAWSWRAFNEPACAVLAHQANARIISYEALCADPDAEGRRIMAFCGLDWHRQIQTFLARSSHHGGPAGYYSVFRDAIAAAQNWRTSMPQEDQEAVCSVVAGSPLAAWWSEPVK